MLSINPEKEKKNEWQGALKEKGSYQYPFSPLYSFVDLTCDYARQRGTEDVMIYLSKEAQNEKVKGILFLMPCHATPYFSTLHYDLPMRILDCSPRFGVQQFGQEYIS